MRHNAKLIAGAVLSTFVLGACATKGYVRNQVETGITTERTARMSADSALTNDVASVRSEVATLKTDVASLRRDLTALRDEFGAKITAMENGMKFAFPVTFAFDDATVRDEDRPALDRFAQVVNKYYGGTLVTIEGFADPAGGTRYNQDLSKRRADAVAAYLSQAGLGSVTIKTIGYGETRQVNPNAERDDPGAQANRRVVFVIETAAGGAVTSTSQ
ncbi:MAG TPA: OmpA family protein [Gemmatimonadaceae bacterium]|nr:OmpA family protein [Gemmatimonadaceae bacterium]